MDGLISLQFKDRLAKRITKDYGFDHDKASLIVEGTVQFLKLCADYPHERFAPSKLIDIGWHAFLLYTKEYQDFCQRVAGRFLHHEPKEGSSIKIIKTSHDTVLFMKKNGIIFERSLWKTCETHEEVKAKMDQKRIETKQEPECCAPSCGGPCCCDGSSPW